MKKLECTLIVEDDANTAFLNGLLLKDMKISNEVEIASNGQEALKVLEKGKIPELILLDLNMPVMDGFEFLESFRSLFNNIKQNITIVLLSTSFRKKDMDLAHKYKVADVIEKPLTEDKLLDVLKKYF